MAISTSETQRQWRAHNNLRRGSFITWNAAWSRYYIEQGRILLNNITEPGVIFNPRQVEALFVKMYQDVGGTFANMSFDRLKSANGPQVTKASDEFVNIWENSMAEYARVFGAESIVSISNTGIETAKKLIADATAQAIEEGLSTQELARRIEELVWDEWKIVSKFNAQRIARTEIIAASNEGAFIGAQSSGLTLRKIWLTAMDGRERATHAAANGQTRAMNEPFNVGITQMSKPGDKNAPASESINCRCAISFTTGLF